jgi:putative hemolysin
MLIILALILLNGLFSMSEIALIYARKSRLSSDAKNGDKGAKKALDMAEQPDKFLSTVQIGITLIGILTGIFSGVTIATPLSHWLENIGVPTGYAMTIAQTAIVIIVTYLTLVFGELLPKRIGMSMAEKIAKIMSRPMNLLSKIVSPFVLLLSRSTSMLFKLMGLKDGKTKVTEEEIKSIVQEGAENGVVQPVEQDLVERVFMMGDLNVDSIMTQRNDLVWLDVSMNVGEVSKILSESLFDFYPVADGNLDKLLGVAALKQLVLYLNCPDFNIRNILTEPTYFYENTKVYKVMELMKEAHVSRGIVVDEFGTCIGIVTLKDIIEGLFGSMPEEHEEPQIIKRDNGDGWLVDGSCTMLNFLTYFDDEDKMVDEDFNTVAGLCINQFRHIPKRGEHFNWKRFCFEIVDVDHAKIDTILVNRI